MAEWWEETDGLDDLGLVDLEDIKVNEGLAKFAVKEKGLVSRIAFPLIMKDNRLFLKKVSMFTLQTAQGDFKGNFVAPEDEVLFNKCKACLGDVKEKYITFVLQYDTTTKGELKEGHYCDLKLLFLAPGDIVSLQTLRMSHDFKSVDFFVTTDNPKYHHKKFVASKNCSFRDTPFFVDVLGIENRFQGDELSSAIAKDFVKDMLKGHINMWEDAKILEKLEEFYPEIAEDKEFVAGDFDVVDADEAVVDEQQSLDAEVPSQLKQRQRIQT